MPTFDQCITSLRQEFGEQDAGKKFEGTVKVNLLEAGRANL